MGDVQAELGQIVASRTFIFGDGVVEVRIGVPYTDDEGKNYFCPFQVIGIGDEKVRRAGGVDALQALSLGMERASMYLTSRPEVKAGSVTFLGSTEVGSWRGTLTPYCAGAEQR